MGGLRMTNNELKHILTILFFFFIAAFLFTEAPLIIKAGEKINAGSIARLKITILYDNYVFTEGTRSDWGFSCLVEGPEKTILFDTGMQPSILKENAEKLKIDLSRIDLVAISHLHMDHLGGLPAVLEKKSPVEVFIPEALPKDVQGKYREGSVKFSVLEKPISLCKGVMLTGPIGQSIKEQSLILNTPKGYIVITGCAHPGIVEIIKKAKELTGGEIYLVLGGFHLLQNSNEQVEQIIAEMKSLGVNKCSACHCTGEKAIALFKKSFGENFIPAGTGKTIVIE
jgi:7,8-dihydropterin-6-yl-methyl-4-(beta-D-ribofuranosyl)aminobenzene 5'-phosphate synthase